MLLRMKKAVFTLGSINLVAMKKNSNSCNFMCARRSGNIFFSFSFFFLFFFLLTTLSKDTEPYKTDVSFLCQYIFHEFSILKEQLH